MHAFYTDRYELPLPEGHRFPMAKYRLLRQAVEVHLPEVILQIPPPASNEELSAAHDLNYIEQVCSNTLPALVQKAIGFPWSLAMVERSRRSTGATLSAAHAALAGQGVAVNLAGGTHHAMRHAGAGFCVFNDAAVTAKVLQLEQFYIDRNMLRVAIVDLDVHQGDGTAQICAGDASILTVSIHAANNFPHNKQQSSLDIALEDGCTDDRYLATLLHALTIVEQFEPQLLIYLAGADPHENDRLGRLKLTQQGLASRDQMFLDWCVRHKVPVAVTMAGGYNKQLSTTVAIHLNTVSAALHAWRSYGNKA